MDTLPKLSPAQRLLLRAAARRADEHVIPPDPLRGGARVKVLTALLQRGWIEPVGDNLTLTDAGLAAIGQQRPALVMTLHRPQGASIQLMLATGWQPHTVRGAISGILRKKLGLNVVLAYNDTDERGYRVV